MDLIIINANIITMNTSIPKAQALAINEGKFYKIGSNEEILKLKDENTTIIDLHNKMVLPGFNDSHMHLVNFGYSLQMVDLSKCLSMEELINKSKEFINNINLPQGKWLIGRGWNQDFFHENLFPTRYDLDKISTKYPICLSRACGHIIIVNSKAIELANINRNTPQIEGGKFDIDETGAPVGIFRENAVKMIYSIIPSPSIIEIKEMILKATNCALSKGITSIQTDDFMALPGISFESIIRAYTELKNSGKLKTRIYQQCLLPSLDKLENFISKGYGTNYGDEFYKIGPLKLLGDGSLGARTAYLTKPYEDDPSTFGIPIFTQEELDEIVIKAHNSDFQIAIHSIGDKAMYMAFESIEKAQKLNFKKDSRHGIIHCQITDETLLLKFKKLDAIAYIQPIFLNYDLHIVESRVGREKAKTSYNWKELFNKGVHVACSSDCPVEPFDVFPGIYCAVTRKDLNGYPINGWIPEQKLSIDQAIYGFTLGGAFASFEEKIKGSIEANKLGDMIVISDNIYEIQEDKIKDIFVEMTFVGGKLVYDINS